MKNDVMLCWKDGKTWKPSHFALREFASEDGSVVIHPSLIRSLELVRLGLSALVGCEVRILITSGTRSVADNERLAGKLGWIEDGGLVARDSRHLPKYGGIAVDMFARHPSGSAWIFVPQHQVADECRRHFVYVKADYPDGHVHADNR